MYGSNEEYEECQMKYFFACIEYEQPHYLYIDKYNIVKRSGTFSLDHYPNKNEIINNVVSYFESDECVYRNPEIITYNELTKGAYDAYY